MHHSFPQQIIAEICMAAADLVWSRVFKEYPDIKVALSEGGTGWIPYFLDRLDRTYDMHHLWTGQDFGNELPSDIFRRHILTCFIADPIGIKLRHEIGVDHVMWGSDFPHVVTYWPNSRQVLDQQMAGVPAEERRKMEAANILDFLGVTQAEGE